MKNQLTVLSYGGGQDSTAILLGLIHSDYWRNKFAPNDLIVVFSDTKNEHISTYQYLDKMRNVCEKHNIPFFVLDPEQYASSSWKKGLVGFYKEKNAVGSKAFPKTCTDNLKIRPIYKFLEQYVHQTYNTVKYGRKQAFYEFLDRYGKINVLIGIAEKEEKRASVNGSSGIKWFDQCINKVYPLIEQGMDRKECQDFIKMLGYEVPFPSNCMLCPFMSLQELLYLYRYDRANFDLWVEMESNKLEANKHMKEKNLGVWGTQKDLHHWVKIAEDKFGHMTKEELTDYKMSHGHCVMSKY